MMIFKGRDPHTGSRGKKKMERGRGGGGGEIHISYMRLSAGAGN